MATIQVRNVRTCSRNGAKFPVGIEFTGSARFSRVPAGIERAPARPQIGHKGFTV
jgi:hypothetical protein